MKVNIGVECDADHSDDECADSSAWIGLDVSEEQAKFLEAIAEQLNADRWACTKFRVSRVSANSTEGE